MSTIKILVPVDGSPHSLRATEQAIKMAGTMAAEILLVHCHKPIPSVLGEPYLQKVINRRLENSNKLLEPYRKILQADSIPFVERILEGEPGRMICESAQIEQCEMIIMGSRGRSNLQGLLLGSTAHRVLHAAQCPVMVVK